MRQLSKTIHKALPYLLAPALAVALAPVGASADADPDPAAAEDERYEADETLTVIDTRLSDEPVDALRLPANVTVLTRETIERSGVDTLQDLLAFEAGAVVYDQVGNDVQKSFDLRGFTGGGTRVYLDGVPLNLPRSNALSLELVPPSALERVEIGRGSASAVAGAGAPAGVVQLRTRSVEDAGGHVELASGEFGTLDGRLDAWGALGATEVFVSGTWFETDGFRENAGGELGRLAGSLAWDLGGGRRLRLTGLSTMSDFGTPGALTTEELADDPDQAPFNELDFVDEGASSLSLGFQGPLTEALSLAANLWVQDRDTEILTTGRAAPAFGGSFLESAVDSLGGTAKIDYTYGSRRQKVSMTPCSMSRRASRSSSTMRLKPTASRAISSRPSTGARISRSPAARPATPRSSCSIRRTCISVRRSTAARPSTVPMARGASRPRRVTRAASSTKAVLKPTWTDPTTVSSTLTEAWPTRVSGPAAAPSGGGRPMSCVSGW